MKILFTAIAALLLFIFNACHGNASKESAQADIKEVTLANLDRSVAKEGTEAKKEFFIADSIGKPEGEQEETKQKQQPSSQPTANIDWDKKIIKTATLNFELKDYKAYSSSLREKVKTVGGYIAQEDQSQSEYKIENTVTIKVPVDQFDNALNVLTNGVEKINEKKVSSQDVTAEFVDTRSRMEAKKQVRQRYIDLLKQAKNMEEILNVQSVINDVQEEIESAAGRIQYLGHSSSFSTISMTYYQVLNATAKDNEKPSFTTRFSAAFRTGWSWIGDLFVGIISVWPLLLLAFIGFIVYKRTVKPKVKTA
ncbi:MAG TPA: DUF4349 domain-containing protein [Chitinophagaceae bacterium]